MFNRSVLMQDDTTRRVHETVSVEFFRDSAAVHIRSWELEAGEGNPLDTWLSRELDGTDELEAAEEWAKEHPAFAEHEDPLSLLVDEIADILDDEQAASVPQAFKEWQPDTAYQVGDRRRFEDVLYKCLQAHTSQEGWEPSQAPSLWARILNPDPEVIPVWEQPDSANPYMTGDKVHYPDAEGPVYESTIDNNIWSPEAYPAGWQLVEEEA